MLRLTGNMLFSMEKQVIKAYPDEPILPECSVNGRLPFLEGTKDSWFLQPYKCEAACINHLQTPAVRLSRFPMQPATQHCCGHIYKLCSPFFSYSIVPV